MLNDFKIIRECFVESLSFVQSVAYKDLEITLEKASAALYRIEMRVDPPPIYVARHEYKPHKKYPWFCGDCGYAKDEKLKHV